MVTGLNDEELSIARKNVKRKKEMVMGLNDEESRGRNEIHVCSLVP